MDDKIDFESERLRMVETQLIGRDIRDPLVLRAMRSVPRHEFVSSEYQRLSYTDGPLPIGSGQTISQPYIVALMTQLLELRGDETVLEVGTGSGYQAAVLAQLTSIVHTIERHDVLAINAREVFKRLHISNIHVHIGDGSLGYPEFAPYAAIMVTAAAPNVPQTLLDQLEEDGRLVIPVGGRGGQYLECWRNRKGEFECKNIIPVAFVPLLGRYGWKD